MKKVLLLLLLLVQLFPLALSSAEEVTEVTTPEPSSLVTPEPTPEPTPTAAPLLTVYEAIELAEADYAARHTLEALTSSGEDGGGMELIFASDERDTLLASTQLTIPEVRKNPRSPAQKQTLFLELFDAAGIISTQHGLNIIDLEKYLDQYGGNVKLVIPSQDWWKTEVDEPNRAISFPVYFLDQDSNLVDDTIYICFFVLDAASTRIWVCGDTDIVRDSIERTVNASTIEKASAKNDILIRDWLTTAQDYVYVPPEPEPEPEEIDPFFSFTGAETPTPAPTPAPTPEPTAEPEPVATEIVTPEATAAEDAAIAPTAAAKAQEAAVSSGTYKYIGVVTVISDKSANLREAGDSGAAAVGHAKPGSTYQCISISDSGWYEISYAGGSAYIAPSLVSFDPY